MKVPRFTRAEREEVLEEAIKLIQEPASWTTGEWKCDLIETDKKGVPIRDEEGNLVIARDLYNRPLSQYCIEGAVNQAVYNVLGEERAIKLGAYDQDEEFHREEYDGIWPTDILGIDELARDLYPDLCAHEERAAMIVNDYHNAHRGERSRDLGHKRILGLLRTKLADLRGEERKGDAAINL